MRAVVTTAFGSGPAVAEVPTPSAGAGEVRVRVRSSSLNGFDPAMAYGYFQGVMEHQFPAVLGRDFAGTVDEIGAGVTTFAPGDDVFGVVLTQPLNAGGFAEYVVLPADHNITRIPSGVAHATAGVLGLAGSAALATIATAGPVAGERVLISGATGGVGAIAVQLLSAAGVVVIATAQPGDETAHVRELGAAFAIDRTGDVAAQVRDIAPDGVDAVLHFAGDARELAALVVPGGRLVSLLPLGPEFAELPITATSVVADATPAVLDRLVAEVAAGRIRVPVQRTYELAEVPSAFADFAGGTLGKLAVSIG